MYLLEKCTKSSPALLCSSCWASAWYCSPHSRTTRRIESKFDYSWRQRIVWAPERFRTHLVVKKNQNWKKISIKKKYEKWPLTNVDFQVAHATVQVLFRVQHLASGLFPVQLVRLTRVGLLFSGEHVHFCLQKWGLVPKRFQLLFYLLYNLCVFLVWLFLDYNHLRLLLLLFFLRSLLLILLVTFFFLI